MIFHIKDLKAVGPLKVTGIFNTIAGVKMLH